MAQSEFLGGMLRVLILAELAAAAGYGYGIAKGIEEKSGSDLTVRPESLYPVLHRMEQEGLLKSHWEEAANGRPRKMYAMTPKGRRRWDKLRPQFLRQTEGALRALRLSDASGAKQ